MRTRKWAIPLAVGVLAFIAGQVAQQASATPDPDGDGHKVGICHRTASDTNPYVFIEVDEASLSPGHLDNDDPGHKPRYWKSDGTWRGVDHVEGDAKDDYLAPNGASDCVDTDPPCEQDCEEPVEVRATVTFIDPTCKAPEARVVADSTEEGVTYYTEGDEQPGGTVKVTALADEGYVLVGQTVFTHTFDSLKGDCKPDKPGKPDKPEPPNPPRYNPPRDLAETGSEAAVIGGIAALLALMGTVALRASRYVKGS